MPTTSVPHSVTLLKLATGFWSSQALYAVARLGIADVLGRDARSADEIATDVGANPGAIYRLLRAAASLGVVAEDSARRFALTPMGEPLRAGDAGSMRAVILSLGQFSYAGWHGIVDSVRTGGPAFEAVVGTPFFDYIEQDEERASLFAQAMRAQSLMSHVAMLNAYDFSAHECLLDVGGGTGSLLEHVLVRQPRMRGILLDRPRAIEAAQARWQQSPLRDRVRLEAGDFFDHVPAGADVHALAMVLHDWDDERCVSILENCRAALRPEGVVLISELMIPPGNAPFFGKLLDLDMLVCFGGRERTEAEYRTLLERAGFSSIRTVSAAGTASALSVMIASRGE
jgi:2-polyprenyl-3-methyl-5-hydroxy-6-metoxy-1,4-benzoquinol methylase